MKLHEIIDKILNAKSQQCHRLCLSSYPVSRRCLLSHTAKKWNEQKNSCEYIYNTNSVLWPGEGPCGKSGQICFGVPTHHNVRSTRADSKWNKTFEYSWALFKVEMAASSPSNNSCASQNATGVWNRLKPEEFQQLQEYTKCKIALLCFLNCYWKLLNPPLCL